MDLFARAKSILTTPKTEWPVIAGESTGTSALYSGYVAPLAAISPLATIVGNLLFAGGLSFAASIAIGVLSFVMAFVAV
ncbi:MAG TPA: hypothetical protein VNX67_08090, partial [Solirubrobacteraceae bacterium]|nr:hypothetical protein [Solirubrobacteraceae bacterium]